MCITLDAKRMTKREYNLLVASIRLAYEQPSHSVDYQLGVQFTAQTIAQALTKANPTFNSIRFLVLCGLESVN